MRDNDSDVVPRRMLELCRDTLRRCLAVGIGREQEQAARIDALEAEVARLRSEVDRLRG